MIQDIQYIDAVREDDGTSESADEDGEGDSQEDDEGQESEIDEGESRETQNLMTTGPFGTPLQEDKILSPWARMDGNVSANDDSCPETASPFEILSQVPAPQNETERRSGGLSSHPASPDRLTQTVKDFSLLGIRTKVTSDLSKTRSHQERKHHSKRSTRQVGRPEGSKAKQDKKVRLDRSGIWD